MSGEILSKSRVHPRKICCTRDPENLVESVMSESAKAELQSVMEKRRKASLAGDSNNVASLLADDYVQTDVSGYVQDKTNWFKEYFNPLADLIKAGKFRWEVFDQKELEFRIFGDSAVVAGVLEAKGIGAKWVPQKHTREADPNAGFSGTLRFTHVYVRRDGKWLLAALHNAVPFSAALTHTR